MRFFKSKSKSYSTKTKTQQASSVLKPINKNDHKSLLSLSPAESSLLNASNSKAQNPAAGIDISIHAQVLVAGDKSSEEPANLNPNGMFQFIPKVNIEDDEPEASRVMEASRIEASRLEQPVSPERTTLIIQQDKLNAIMSTKTVSEPKKIEMDNPNSVMMNYKELTRTQSLTNIGPNDVEVSAKDAEKGVKVNLTKDPRSFSDKKKPAEDLLDSAKERDPTSSSRPLIVDFIAQGENKPQEDYFDSEHPRNKNMALASFGDQQEEFPAELRETKSILVPQGASRINRNNKERKTAIVVFAETEVQSVSVKRATTDKPLISKEDNFSMPDSNPTTQGDKRELKLKTKKGTRRPKNRDTMKKQNLLPKEPLHIPLLFIIIGYILLMYGALPFGLFFSAYPYEGDRSRAAVNFGILGFIQGIVQALLLYQLIDLPILKKITEIEGRNKGLLNPNKYLVINKLSIFCVVAVSTGLQIAAGVTIVDMDKRVTGTRILVSSLCTIAIEGILWFIFVIIQNPRALRNESRILDTELKEIGQIRKDFMADLQDTRKKMEIKSLNPNLPASIPQIVSPVFLGVSSNAALHVNVDARKLLHKVYDYSSEFARIRLKSIKTFMILIFSITQALISIHIIRLAENSNNLAESILSVLLLFIVGSIFGFFDLFTSATKPVMNTMKLSSLIVTAACYRFLFIDLTDKSKMIGAVVMKLVYKLLLYYLVAIFGEKLIKKSNTDKTKSIVIEFYDSVQEKEASYIKYPIYLFQKFALLQEVDLFFAIISLFLPVGAENWLDNSQASYRLKIDEYTFYLGLVLVEIAANLLLGVTFVYLMNNILKKRAKTTSVNLGAEFVKLMKEKKWVIIGFKCLLLYILIFVFFNEL